MTPVHAPALHAAVSKHVGAGQAVPSGSSGFELQAPVLGLQVPLEWHESLAAQEIGVPVQVPDWQLSAVVQRLPSLHESPLATATVAHDPVLGLHSLAWHADVPAAQVTGFDATQ